MAIITYRGAATKYKSYILRPGDPYRYDNVWLIDRDDGFYKFGISRLYTALTTGDYSGTTNITVNGKTESKSNNCVQDERTGLMWAKTPSGTVGPANDGCLRWDDHCDVVEHDGATGGYVSGEVLTQAVTGDTALIRYVDATNNLLGVVNPSTRPFAAFANAVTSQSGGPDTIQTYTEGAGEDVWAYVSAANESSFAGHTDWRVPNMFELLSIMWYSVTSGDAEPNNTYFTMPADTSKIIWTSTHEGPFDRTWQPVAGYDFDNADAMRFDTGYFVTDVNAFKASVTGYVYLVRGPIAETYQCMLPRTGAYAQAAGEFPDDAFAAAGLARSVTIISTQTLETFTARDGTTFNFYGIPSGGSVTSDVIIEDNYTSLTWTYFNTSEACPYYDSTGQRFDAVDVVRMVNADAFLGYNDWRLPNLFEAASLMVAPVRAWSWAFGDYTQDFWTCTPDPNDATKVFYHTYGGYFDVADRESGGDKYVRLVRGGVTDDDL